MASKVVPLLILLLSIDVFFMLAHIAYLLGWLTNSFWSVEKDSSFSEWYQHLKEGSIVALLIYHSFKIKKIDYLPWGLLFLYVLLDDALMVHEKLGGHLDNAFDLPVFSSLREQDIGEFIVSAFFGAGLLILIFLRFFWCEVRVKHHYIDLLVLFSALVLFGIGVDMVHMMVSSGAEVWGLIEDGGELLVMSLIVFYIVSLSTGEQLSAPTASSENAVRT